MEIVPLNRSLYAELPRAAESGREALVAAFGRAAEADLVAALDRAGRLTLALAAEVDGQAVGVIAFSPMTLPPGAEHLAAFGLGPLGVRPECQRRGIGSELVRRGLAAMAELGAEAIFLLGNPRYYSRFGFEPAARYGFRYGVPANERAFQVFALNSSALEGAGGLVAFAPEFAGV